MKGAGVLGTGAFPVALLLGSFVPDGGGGCLTGTFRTVVVGFAASFESCCDLLICLYEADVRVGFKIVFNCCEV